MKILLITFDKEMEQRIRNLLKDYQIITAKNGEEALLLNVENDVGLVIYDALAGGIAEEDINKLYEEGFKDVPYIILMDDLFPIDPNNVKPKNKKVISREVEVDKLPELVEEILQKGGVAAEEKKEEVAPATEETSWEQMFGGVTTVEAPKEEVSEAPAEAPPTEELVETAPAEVSSETKVEETAPPEVSQPTEVEEETAAPPELPLKKKCLLVSFDMPLVERIEKIIGDSCDLAIARSAKQALQKYGNEFFDIIIFDTISGVFAEKGIKDLYEKGGYKDSLYVVLLDEMLPLDVDKLPVKNLRAIKRESEIDLLPEIIESAPHISLEKALQAPPKAEEVAPPKEEKVEEVKVETPKVEEKPPAPAKVEEKPKAVPKVEEKPAPAKPVEVVQISEEQIAKIVEAKINEKILPLVEEIVRSKLSEIYVKAIARELVEEQIDTATIKETIREIAEPLVKETLEELLS